MIEKLFIQTLFRDFTNLIDTIDDILEVEAFTNDLCKEVYLSALECYNKGNPVTPTSVNAELKKRDIKVQSKTLLEFWEYAPTTANLEYYARLMMQKLYQRRLKDISLMAAELSQKGDIFEGIEQVETQLSGIYGDLTNEETLDEQTKRTYELILQNTIKYQNKEITGISTGIDELDRYTNGWQKKSLNIIAGRPGMGKSVAGLSTALAALKLGKSVVFFSLEMSSEEVLMRLTSMLSGVPLYKIKNGEINKDETILVAKTLEKINQYNFTLIDSSLELSKLRRYVKRYSRQGKADIVVIDYLQLITTPNQKLRRDEVAIVSKTLKQIAKESDIPIIALAQINRDNEKRAKEDKRPQLSDLAESASIEQDADIVIMLYRAEYYNPEAIDEHGYSVKGRGEYIIRKQRSGAIGTCHVEFNSRTMLYKNL